MLQCSRSFTITACSCSKPGTSSQVGVVHSLYMLVATVHIRCQCDVRSYHAVARDCMVVHTCHLLGMVCKRLSILQYILHIWYSTLRICVHICCTQLI